MGGLHEKGLQWGAEVLSEQVNDMDKMSSHTARYASVRALWYEVTGDRGFQRARLSFLQLGHLLVARKWAREDQPGRSHGLLVLGRLRRLYAAFPTRHGLRARMGAGGRGSPAGFHLDHPLDPLRQAARSATSRSTGTRGKCCGSSACHKRFGPEASPCLNARPSMTGSRATPSNPSLRGALCCASSIGARRSSRFGSPRTSSEDEPAPVPPAERGTAPASKHLAGARSAGQGPLSSSILRPTSFRHRITPRSGPNSGQPWRGGGRKPGRDCTTATSCIAARSSPGLPRTTPAAS